MDYLGVLKDLAAKFKVNANSPGSPLEPRLDLVAPPELRGAEGLVLNETVRRLVPVEVPLKVDLSFLGKWVRSGDDTLPADPAAEDPIGGMPIISPQVVGTAISNALPSDTLMVTDQNGTPPGVPELLGRVKGTILQTVDKVQEVIESHAVAIAIQWRVFDMSESGTSPAASGVSYKTAPTDAWQDLPLKELSIPTNGIPIASPPTSLMLKFGVFFSELTAGLPDVMKFNVQVSVNLSLSLPAPTPAVTTGWIELPPIPLIIPTVPVPTIVVLCEHRKFTGRKLVLVPTNSLLGTTAPGGISIGSALSLTNSALSTLAPANNLIGFLAAAPNPPVDAAANVLKSLVAATGDTIVAAHSRVDNLDTPELVFDPGGFLNVGRFTGDNMASSLICIGRPGTEVEFDLDQYLSHRITPLIIKLGNSLGCAIHRLDRIDVPSDVVYGEEVTSFSPQTTFEDRISSVGFTTPSGRFIAA